jgi:hypothetical protein
MRALLLTLGLVFVGLDLLGRVWTDTNEAPNSAFTALMEHPAQSVREPKTNGYLLLLGLAASTMDDPVQTGHDMWLEASSDAGHGYFNYDAGARKALAVRPEALTALRLWGDQNPLGLLRSQDNVLRTALVGEDVMLRRYHMWLHMPFDDWGFGLVGLPRCTEIFAVHRLYMTETLSHGAAKTVERLEREITMWRTALAQAKTLPIKMLAASVVDDDLALVAGLLNQQALDSTLTTRLAALVRPLNAAERSLRWPIQNEFVLGVKRYDRKFGEPSIESRQAAEDNKHWVTILAGLKSDAFQNIEHPGPSTPLARIPGLRERTLNAYANYYYVLLRTSDQPNQPLPKLSEFVRTASPSNWDYLFSPADALLGNGFTPAWEPFIHRLGETDARLRLAGLQLKLRRAVRPQEVPARIAQAGSALFDPFTGLPMLWSSTQSKIYSVGKDGLDDGGDPTFDISLPLALKPAGAPPPASHSRPKRVAANPPQQT